MNYQTRRQLKAEIARLRDYLAREQQNGLNEARRRGIEVRDAISETNRAVRHETLQTVIDALDLREYAGPTRDPHPAIFLTRETPEERRDRFWRDITTALAVRVEQKCAQERLAAEARVSRLSEKERLTFTWTGSSNDDVSGLRIFSNEGTGYATRKAGVFVGERPSPEPTAKKKTTKKTKKEASK